MPQEIRQEVLEENQCLINEVIKGIFIYPTDTIYGIGCDAYDEEMSEKIRRLKSREGKFEKPFSVIAPDKEWIYENFDVSEKEKEQIESYLPGQYTFILKKKNPEFLSSVSGNEFVGVRIPDSPITEVLQKTGRPIVTTSVNISGEEPANSLEDIPIEITENIDYIIPKKSSENLTGQPSTLIKGGEIINR